jgi:hypothetical protein
VEHGGRHGEPGRAPGLHLRLDHGHLLVARSVPAARSPAGPCYCDLVVVLVFAAGPVTAVDVLACTTCQGRMKLLGMVEDPAVISHILATVGALAARVHAG